MKASLIKLASDRGARVNEELGRALGVSSQGLLRSGRQIEDYTGAEWNALLRTVTSAFKGRIDPLTGALGPTLTLEAVPDSRPVVAERLAVLADLRRRIGPSLDSLRLRGSFEDSSPEEVQALIQQIEIGFGALIQAIDADFEPSLIADYVGRLSARSAGGARTGLLWDLHAVVQEGDTDSLDEERIAYRLATVADEVAAFASRIRSDDRRTPLHAIREIVDGCRRGVEDALSSLDEHCDQIGLLESDLGSVTFPDNPALSLADRIAATRRDYVSVAQLMTVGGARQIKDARHLVIVNGERMKPVARLTQNDLCRRLTISREEAEELLPRLQRLAGRVRAGADQLRDLDRALGGATQTKHKGGALQPGGYKGRGGHGPLGGASPKPGGPAGGRPGGRGAPPAGSVGGIPRKASTAVGVSGFQDFPSRQNVAPNTWIESACQTVKVTSPAPIRISGKRAQYKIVGKSSWTYKQGFLDSGAEVQVRVKSPSHADGCADAILHIADAVGTFRVTTWRTAPIDGDFEMKADQPPEVLVVSERKAIGGSGSMPVTLVSSPTSAEYRIWAGKEGEWTSNPGEVRPGDEIEVRLLSSKVAGGMVFAELRIGEAKAGFLVLTEGEAKAPDPDKAQMA